jgi:hypothetical protein
MVLRGNVNQLRALFLASTLLLWSTAVSGETNKPERRARGNTLVSERDPKLRVELPSPVKYVGADRWLLFGVADCELHVFVETNDRNVIKRLYWLQFESYIPSQPDLHYSYPFAKTDELNGLLFDVRARFGAGNDKPKPGSDLEHVKVLLQKKNLELPAGSMNVRFVHLLDVQKRKEFMIIYGEDLSSTGFAVEDLLPGGKKAEQWPTIEAALIQRAKNAIHISLP